LHLRATKYLTKLKNNLTMKLKIFMIRATLALYPGLSRKERWIIVESIRDDIQYEQEIEFVHKKTSRRRKNEASVISAAVQEHRAVLRLANAAEKVSATKKVKKKCYPLILRYFVFLDRELERKVEMKLSEGGNEEQERRRAVVMGTRFNVVLFSKIKWRFVTIDSTSLFGITKEICPEFDVRVTEFTGENRETYWKNIFDFKCLKTSRQKALAGIIETDGVALCVHCRRLKADHRGPSARSPVTKQEDEKEADPATQKVQDNDFVVGLDTGKTNIMAITAPKCAEDGTDSNLRQKDMRLLKFSRAIYCRESGIMNERKKTETWNAGVKEHLEAISQLPSRVENFEAFQEFMKVGAAHNEEL